MEHLRPQAASLKILPDVHSPKDQLSLLFAKPHGSNYVSGVVGDEHQI